MKLSGFDGMIINKKCSFGIFIDKSDRTHLIKPLEEAGWDQL